MSQAVAQTSTRGRLFTTNGTTTQRQSGIIPELWHLIQTIDLPMLAEAGVISTWKKMDRAMADWKRCSDISRLPALHSSAPDDRQTALPHW